MLDLLVRTKTMNHESLLFHISERERERDRDVVVMVSWAGCGRGGVPFGEVRSVNKRITSE